MKSIWLAALIGAIALSAYSTVQIKKQRLIKRTAQAYEFYVDEEQETRGETGRENVKGYIRDCVEDQMTFESKFNTWI